MTRRLSIPFTEVSWETLHQTHHQRELIILKNGTYTTFRDEVTVLEVWCPSTKSLPKTTALKKRPTVPVCKVDGVSHIIARGLS